MSDDTPYGIIIENLEDTHDLVIGNKNVDDFVKYVKHILVDFCDLIIKRSLMSYNSDYYVSGDKSLKHILSLGMQHKSSDFDINVKDAKDIEQISQHIVSECDDLLSYSYTKIYRYQIFLYLLYLQIVDDNLYNYYMYDKIIYYGKIRTIKDGIETISSDKIFIKIAIEGYSVHNVGKRTNMVGPLEHLQREYEYNYCTYYIPIANIGIDNLTVYVNPSLIKINEINYAFFPIILINILKSMTKEPNKLIKNIKKYRHIVSPHTYNKSFLKKYCNQATLLEMFANVASSYLHP